jgi:hypothetical protein
MDYAKSKTKDSLMAQFGIQFILITISAALLLFTWKYINASGGELEAIYIKISQLQSEPSRAAELGMLYEQAGELVNKRSNYSLLQIIFIALGAMSLVPTITILQMKAFTDIPFTKLWLLGLEGEISETQQQGMLNTVRTIYFSNAIIAAVAVLSVVIGRLYS